MSAEPGVSSEHLCLQPPNQNQAKGSLFPQSYVGERLGMSSEAGRTWPSIHGIPVQPQEPLAAGDKNPKQQ